MAVVLVALVVVPFVVAVVDLLRCRVGVSQAAHGRLGGADVRARARARSRLPPSHTPDHGGQRCCGSTPSRWCSWSPRPSSTRATAIFAGGYLHLADSAAGRRYGRRFYAGLNLFCWSMVAAPLRQRPRAVVGGDRGHDGHLGAARRHRRHRRCDRSGVEVRPARIARPRHRAAGDDHHVLRRDRRSSARPTTSPTASCWPGRRASRQTSSGWPTCWRCSASGPRWASSRCTPGCPTPTPKRRRRSRPCSRERCWRPASTPSCASSRSPCARSARPSRATCCSSSAWRRCCSPRCTCSASAT